MRTILIVAISAALALTTILTTPALAAQATLRQWPAPPQGALKKAAL